MTVRTEKYGKISDGTEVYRYILENKNGVKVAIINYGAIVESIITPDRNGDCADIALGFDNLNDWVTRNTPYFGATIGRCANRIGSGRFSIDGKEYQLAINNGPNCLHGGRVGFDKKVWNAEIASAPDTSAVRLTFTSPDGDENFPGELTCAVCYTLQPDNGLVIDYSATTDKATIVNLTNHTYFNLGGHDSGHIGGNIIWIDADAYTPNDETSLATGEIESLDGKPFDFRRTTAVKDVLNEVGSLDHNYVLNNVGSLKTPVAILKHPASGRVMEVFTTEPGMQLYSADYLDSIKGKGGTIYDNQTGLCFEAQSFPDAINHDNFPEVILRPGENYRQTTIYRFKVD